MDTYLVPLKIPSFPNNPPVTEEGSIYFNTTLKQYFVSDSVIWKPITNFGYKAYNSSNPINAFTTTVYAEQTSGAINTQMSPVWMRPLATLSLLNLVTINVGTATAITDSDGSWTQLTTSAIINADGGLISQDGMQLVVKPTCLFRVKYTDSTLKRAWVGMSETDLVAVTLPSTNVAAFRYDTTATDTTWKTVTANGTSREIQDSGVQFEANKAYKMVIDIYSDRIMFFINEVWVTTHTIILPSTTASMRWLARIATTTASSRKILFGRVSILVP